MKSTLLNMTAVLFGITLVASAGVGVVNMITVEPIAAAKAAATTAALSEVLPPFDETATEQMTIDELPITVYTATKDGEVSGYAVESMTKQGFNGVVRLMVGFTPDGTIYNVNVLEQAETPGLGTKMADEGNPLLGSVKGQNPAEKKLVDGRLGRHQGRRRCRCADRRDDFVARLGRCDQPRLVGLPERRLGRGSRRCRFGCHELGVEGGGGRRRRCRRNGYGFNFNGR